MQAPHSLGFLLKTIAIDWVFSGLDGWHAGGVYAGGFHGPAVLSLAVGSLVATVPAGCPYQVVGSTNDYVCNGTWYQPYYGNNGLYYRVVPPL